MVTARDKLNGASLNGALVGATLLAALAGSWSVFFVALIALVFSAVLAGDIRRPRLHS